MEVEHCEVMEQAWDDATGVEFNPDMVQVAREEDADYIKKAKSYNKIPISECWTIIGMTLIKVRRIYINIGDVKAAQ